MTPNSRRDKRATLRIPGAELLEEWCETSGGCCVQPDSSYGGEDAGPGFVDFGCGPFPDRIFVTFSGYPTSGYATNGINWDPSVTETLGGDTPNDNTMPHTSPCVGSTIRWEEIVTRNVFTNGTYALRFQDGRYILDGSRILPGGKIITYTLDGSGNVMNTSTEVIPECNRGLNRTFGTGVGTDPGPLGRTGPIAPAPYSYSPQHCGDIMLVGTSNGNVVSQAVYDGFSSRSSLWNQSSVRNCRMIGPGGAAVLEPVYEGVYGRVSPATAPGDRVSTSVSYRVYRQMYAQVSCGPFGQNPPFIGNCTSYNLLDPPFLTVNLFLSAYIVRTYSNSNLALRRGNPGATIAVSAIAVQEAASYTEFNVSGSFNATNPGFLGSIFVGKLPGTNRWIGDSFGGDSSCNQIIPGITTVST